MLPHNVVHALSCSVVTVKLAPITFYFFIYGMSSFFVSHISLQEENYERKKQPCFDLGLECNDPSQFVALCVVTQTPV